MSTSTLIIHDERLRNDYTDTDIMFAWIFFGVVFGLIILYCCFMSWETPHKSHKRVLHYVIDIQK
jgi:hypothetical protein